MALEVDTGAWALSLPDRRTLLGIGLAALSALLVLVLTRPAPTVPVLVAGADLPAGTPLEQLDLEVRHVADATGMVVGDELGDLAGWSLARPLTAGEPLLPSLLRAPEVAAAGSTMSVAVDASHAVLGRLSPGDHVDIYRTVSVPGSAPSTERIAASVYVVDVAVTPSSVGGDEVRLLVAVDDTVAARLAAASHGSVGIDVVRVGP